MSPHTICWVYGSKVHTTTTHHIVGDTERAESLYLQAIATLGSLDDAEALAALQHNLALLRKGEGVGCRELVDAHSDRGRTLLGIERVEKRSRESLKQQLFVDVARIHLSFGEEERAIRVCEEGLDDVEIRADPAVLAALSEMCGFLLKEKEEYDGAEGMYQRALEIHQSRSDDNRTANIQFQLGNIGFLRYA